MLITVKYFGPWKGLLGMVRQEFDIADQATVADALAAVEQAHGELYARGMEHGQVFLRRGAASDYRTPSLDEPIDATCTVLLSGPVEGG